MNEARQCNCHHATTVTGIGCFSVLVCLLIILDTFFYQHLLAGSEFTAYSEGLTQGTFGRPRGAEVARRNVLCQLRMMMQEPLFEGQELLLPELKGSLVFLVLAVDCERSLEASVSIRDNQGGSPVA